MSDYIVGTTDGDEPSAICGFCQKRLPLDAIFRHIEGVHGLAVEVAEWPDGEPVIVDSTLEPSDFAAAGGTEGDTQ